MEIIRNNFQALANPSPLAAEVWRDGWIGCPLFACSVYRDQCHQCHQCHSAPPSQDCFVVEEESTLELYLQGTSWDWGYYQVILAAEAWPGLVRPHLRSIFAGAIRGCPKSRVGWRRVPETNQVKTALLLQYGWEPSTPILALSHCLFVRSSRRC